MTATVRSNPKRLAWYHKLVVVVCACLLTGVVILLFFGSKNPSFEPILDLLFLLGLLGGILYRDLVGAEIATYDESTLLEYNSIHALDVAYPFTRLKCALARTPSCVVLQAPSPEAGFPVHTRGGTVHLTEITIRGNEDDIAKFVNTLRAANVVVTDDGMGDDPPQRLAAMLIIAFGSLAAVVYVILKIAQPH